MTNVTALSHDGSQHEVMAELIEHYNKGEVSGIYVAFTMPNGWYILTWKQEGG